MTGAAPSVLVVAPGAKIETPHQAQVRTAVEAEAATRGWPVMPFVRTVEIAHAIGESTGRKVAVLTAQDTETVYRAAHRGPLAVLASSGYRIRRDPRADPSTDRVLWAPQDFLRYKAHASVVRATGDAPEALDAALDALAGLACAGPNDPRTLPMHVFAPAGHADDLGTSDGRTAFKSRHGGPATRVDGECRQWKKGPNHGLDQLVVAGSSLPTGFHWDVSVRRGSSTFANGWQVWELVDRNAYVNIAPDAGVRDGQRCKQRWPARAGR